MGEHQVEPELFGPYRLDGLLGRGGMGEVHRAFDTVKKRTVALKRLRRELAADEDFQRRFRRESEHAARLSDPHVIPIHDYGEIDGILFIDMRFVRGTDFGTLLREQGPLPAVRTVHLISQVASALDAAHAEGLVHRDVKPSNALTTGEDHDDFVYLVDFGIVASVAPGATSLTLAGTTVGTLEYMAPERFGDGAHDHRVDVYALGCMLHELLTGSRPFPTQSVGALLNAHLNTPPPRPTATRADVPGGLDDVVARAMAKDPDDRFVSAGALARAARGALAGPPAETLGPVAESARRPAQSGARPDEGGYDGPASGTPPGARHRPSAALGPTNAPAQVRTPPPYPGAPLPGAPLPGAPLPGAALPGAALPGAALPGAGPRIPAPRPRPPEGTPAAGRSPGSLFSGTPLSGTPLSGTPSSEPSFSGTPFSGTPPPGAPSRARPDVEPRRDDDRTSGWFARHRRPVMIAVGLVLAVLLVAGGLVRMWVLAQYYVGASDGKVAVFQGVQGTVLGLPLHTEVVKSNIALTDLPGATRTQVEDGIVITDGGLTGAYARVDQLRAAVLPPCPSTDQGQDNPAAEPGVTCRVVS